MGIFKLFSKRDKALPDTFSYDKLPPKLRVQIVHILRHTLCKVENLYGEVQPICFDQIHRIVCEEHGVFHLSEQHNTVDDVLNCILKREDVPLVLDVIEASIHVLLLTPELAEDLNLQYRGRKPSEAIDDLNYRFRENGVGYEFNENAGMLIRVDSIATHREIIQPTLSLLTARRFKNANAEFVASLADYRHGNYGDALTKCGSAYESVMKVICDGKKWPYPEKATASPLVKAIIAGTGLDPCYEQMLIAPATIRNRLSTAHGGGKVPRKTEEHQFKFALHLTAAAIQFLAEETA